MKKIFSLALVWILVLGLCACGSSGEKAPEGLQVGFGRVMVAPDYEVQLAGGAATRVSDGYQDYQYITCVALRQGEETYMVCTMDFICAEDVFVDPAKALMSQATGVPEENILLNATHTHAGVAIRSDGSKNVEQYRKDFFAWAEEAAKAAIEDLSPATVSYGSSKTEKMAFVRHYLMQDGTYAGPNYGSFSTEKVVGHSNEADTELQLIKFTRAAEDKKDVVMMNFPAHATMTQTSTTLSADFPAPTREYIEENTDSLVAYFIAAAGDQVPSSRIPGESFSVDYRIYGAELGRIAVETMNNLTPIETTDFGYCHRTFSGTYPKEGIERLADAKAVEAEWKVVGRGTSQGSAAAKEHGFSSVYEVSAIITRAQKDGEPNSMEIKTLALGDIGFVFAPYEMFGSDGMYIKEQSPYPMTFMITCAEGAEGYLPSELGFQMNCYESHVTRFERGTAKLVADEFISMLTEMKTPKTEQ